MEQATAGKTRRLSELNSTESESPQSLMREIPQGNWNNPAARHTVFHNASLPYSVSKLMKLGHLQILPNVFCSNSHNTLRSMGCNDSFLCLCVFAVHLKPSPSVGKNYAKRIQKRPVAVGVEKR